MRFSYRTAGRWRGFYLVGLLIVLVIILILTYKELKPEEKAAQVTQAQVYIDRSRDVLCESNRAAIAQNLTMWRIDHAGETASIDVLRRADFNIPVCPKGGVYTISPDGSQVYCSVHFPPPAGPSSAAAPAPKLPGTTIPHP